MSDTLTFFDRLLDVETKVRHVRTPSGVDRFHEPLGSPIIDHPDIPHGRSGGHSAHKPGSGVTKPVSGLTGGSTAAMAVPAGSPLKKVPDQYEGFSKYQGGGKTYHVGPHQGQFAIMDGRQNGISLHATRAEAIKAMHEHAIANAKVPAKKSSVRQRAVNAGGKGKMIRQKEGTVLPDGVKLSNPKNSGRKYGFGAKMNDRFILRFPENADLKPASLMDINKYNASAEAGGRIPGQLSNVHINKDPNGEPKFWGQDQRQINAKTWNKPQQYMSTSFRSKQNIAKFARGGDLSKSLPKLDKALVNDANTNDNAAAVAIMRHMGLRVGSTSELSGAHAAYGTTTLLRKHVKVRNGTATFDFVGKHGVAQHHITKNPVVVAALTARLANPGGPNERLFPKTTDNSTMAYLDSVIKGSNFKNHDLRTHVANVTANAAIAKLTKGYIVNDQANFRLLQKEVYAIVSKKLGNSPSEARDSYINPEVFLQVAKDAKWIK